MSTTTTMNEVQPETTVMANELTKAAKKSNAKHAKEDAKAKEKLANKSPFDIEREAINAEIAIYTKRLSNEKLEVLKSAINTEIKRLNDMLSDVQKRENLSATETAAETELNSGRFGKACMAYMQANNGRMFTQIIEITEQDGKPLPKSINRIKISKVSVSNTKSVSTDKRSENNVPSNRAGSQAKVMFIDGTVHSTESGSSMVEYAVKNKGLVNKNTGSFSAPRLMKQWLNANEIKALWIDGVEITKKSK